MLHKNSIATYLYYKSSYDTMDDICNYTKVATAYMYLQVKSLECIAVVACSSNQLVSYSKQFS